MLTTLTTRIARQRDRLSERRGIRDERNRLRSELASYRTEADRIELEAVLARHSREDIDHLESLIR